MGERFVFVGNRRFVLEQMLKEGVSLRALVIVAGTHLERDYQAGLLATGAPVHVVRGKQELLDLLSKEQFDVLLSNGCPYILPLEQLPRAKYVNIHPSYLPDLRGADPAIGAILHQRDCGATCHLMDAGVDTGSVISRVLIPYSPDLDVTTLYQLSFVAEKRAFSEALARSFEVLVQQESRDGLIYYNRSLSDRTITFRESNELLLQKVRAFNNRSQGCLFECNGNTFHVFSARKMQNPFLAEVVNSMPECVVALSYEGGIVFHKDGDVLRLEDVRSERGKTLSIGDNLRAP
jgi:methionyl-tRNA formyltransferase